MVGYYGQGVPTTADLENNSNTNKYTVNGKPKGLVIPKLCCCFLVMGALILAAAAALAVFLLLPYCAESKPEAFTSIESVIAKDVITDARLPMNIYPTHYRIKLMPFIYDGNFTTQGFVAIVMKIRKATDKIILNVNDIEIDSLTLRVKLVKDETFMQILDQAYHPDLQIYTIQLDRNLNEGEEYRVEINFVGQLNDLMQGFYRSSYVDSTSNEIRWMASTQFSPTDARRAFPCFDEPGYKAKFTISIARPGNMSSLSNMPKITTLKSHEMDNWYWDNYQETPKMSTYLVAFVVSDLQPFEFNTTGRLFTIWSRKGAIDQAVFASNIGPKVLQYFENYFNIPYPLPKIDMVAVPDFGFSAMENWGLITFRESSLLIDNKLATIQNKRDVALVMSHELAHQWFGNLATPKWWDDLWLKEGFATYFEYLGIDHVEPTWNITEEFPYSEIQDAFSLDGLESSRALSFDVQNSNQIRQAFDKISYSKGASIIRMMQNFLGEEAFKAGLMNYLNKHQFGNANHDDLWNDLTEKAHNIGALDPNITVKDIMDTWVKQPGYPVINAVADYDKNIVHLTQKRFLSSGDEPSEETTWWVPISHATRANPNFDNTKPKLWMKNENHTEFNLDTKNWWLLNIKKTGYYIVNYDETNWKNIISNIMSFPPIVRAQLVSDSMDLAKADLLDYDVPFKLVLAIGRRDDQFVPYITTFNKLDFIYNMLINTQTFGKFDVFLAAAFNAAFENTGFNESPADSYVTQRKRQVILSWACKRPDSRCVIESRHLYRAWMTNLKPISPNVKGIVYCTAIREGGEPEWNFAYDQYLKTNIVSEKNILLDSLGCSSKTWILSRYLNFMIDKDSGVRKQDGERLFSSVATNIVGNSLAFDFLRANWKKINDYYGVAFSRVSKMVSSLTLYMNTPYYLSQLEQFKKENSLGTTEQAFDHAIEKIKGNIGWMNNSYKSIEKWLDDHSIHFGN